jgi:chromosome segregation ATPase
MAVRMPISCFGCNWRCAFSERLCLKRMTVELCAGAVKGFLNEPPEAPDPVIVDLPFEDDTADELLGAVAKVHRTLLELNHQSIERDVLLTRGQARIDADTNSLLAHARRISETLDAMTAANRKRDEAIRHFAEVLALMSEANTRRDEAICQSSDAIAATNDVIAAMSDANAQRDEAIAHHERTFAAMTEHNTARDQTIAESAAQLRELIDRHEQEAARVEQVFSEMTKHNAARDQAIADLTTRSDALYGEIAGRDAALTELRGQIDRLKGELHDLRRRSVRVPTAVARLFRRTPGVSL